MDVYSHVAVYSPCGCVWCVSLSVKVCMETSSNYIIRASVCIFVCKVWDSLTYRVKLQLDCTKYKRTQIIIVNVSIHTTDILLMPFRNRLNIQARYHI